MKTLSRDLSASIKTIQHTVRYTEMAPRPLQELLEELTWDQGGRHCRNTAERISGLVPIS